MRSCLFDCSLYFLECVFEILYSFNFSTDSWQPVNITYENPKTYKGPLLEGWPPGKDRHMPNYIKPDQDTFPLRPSKAHFKGCEILVIVHSAIDNFSMRRGLRDTWIQFVTQKRVANVSVIFLIGNYGNTGCGVFKRGVQN